ncbi:MAG TPA: SDR family oxidoreductase [Solirubrobacteraceae bacterium]|jgi:nucleoside-diphosphate-sugar epimerase|nr:SDR family oxidoreductase [Solirubrobacteraceae bacterium]
MSGARRVVLVTGGTGLVGHAIVDALNDVDVISLTRHGAAGWTSGAPVAGGSAAGLLPDLHGHVVTASDAVAGTRHVQGDVSAPQLGLNDVEHAELAERVDVVVHAAGVSDFTTPRQTTYALNLEGARNTAAFADRAGATLYHVSTGYVNANGTSLGGRWGAGVYIASKRAAEEVVRESRMLAAIVRPSIVWSHSRTGWSPSFQGLHRLVGMMLENKMPLLPFGENTRVDFLPQDTVGEVIADLVRSGFGGEYWLTAGPRAMRFGRVVELVLELGSRLGRELTPPRFIDPEMIDRMIKPIGGETLSRRIDLLLALTTHFSSQDVLPTSVPDSRLPDIEAAFVKGAEHWAGRHGYATLSGAAG